MSPAAPEHETPAAPPQGGRTAFSEEDDAILAQWALENSLVVSKNLFKHLEEAYDHHSWESWRNRWNKKLRKYPVEHLKRIAGMLTVTDDTSTTASDTEAIGGSRARAGQADGKSTGGKATPEQGNKKPTPKQQQTQTASSGVSREEDKTQHPETGSHPNAANDTSPSNEATNNATSATSKQSLVQQAQIRDNVDPDSKPHNQSAPEEDVQEAIEEVQALSGAEVSAEEEDEEDDPRKDQFYRDLISFNDCEPDDFDWPIISGPSETYEIDLYDLAVAYETQNANPEDIEWSEVARELGWVPEEDTWVAAELQRCFEERLFEFLEAMNEDPPSAPEDIEGEELGGQEEVSLAMRSSPPAQPESLKRHFEVEHISSAASVRKRRRLRDVEIPSTPDEAVGLSREIRQAHGLSVSPSVRRDSTQASQQLPLLQRTPSRSKGTSSLHPAGLEGLGGRRERDTSPSDDDENMPSLDAIIRKNGHILSAKARRRTSPPGFIDARSRATSRASSRSTHNLPQESSQDSLTESVSDWLSRHLRSGYPREILDLALHHTTRTVGSAADHIVASLANENGIPKDLPGAWLPSEDRTVKQLMNSDLSEQATCAVELTEQKRLREEQRQLIEKHGWQALNQRKRYLREKIAEEKSKKSSGEVRKKKAVETKAVGMVKLTDEEKRRRQIALQRMMMEEDEEDD